MAAEHPLCFVLMPFGIKKDPVTSAEINFDFIYQQAIRPAIGAAEMEPIRADEERIGGIIHKPMFERLLLCDFAIADLTTGNPNVYCELGVRHAARPMTTLAIFAEYQNLPFDLNLLRALLGLRYLAGACRPKKQRGRGISTPVRGFDQCPRTLGGCNFSQ